MHVNIKSVKKLRKSKLEKPMRIIECQQAKTNIYSLMLYIVLIKGIYVLKMLPTSFASYSFHY